MNGSQLRVWKWILICSTVLVLVGGALTVIRDRKMVRYDRSASLEREYSVGIAEGDAESPEDEAASSIDFAGYSGSFSKWYSIYSTESAGTGDYLYDLAAQAFTESDESSGDSSNDSVTYSDDAFLVYEFKPKTTIMEFKICNQTASNAAEVYMQYEFDDGSKGGAVVPFIPGGYTMITSVKLPESAEKFRLKSIVCKNTDRICSGECPLNKRHAKLYMVGENTLEYRYDGAVLLMDRYGFIHQYVELSSKGKMPVAFGLVKYMKVEDSE